MAPLPEILDGDVVKMLALHQDHAPLDYWQRVEAAVGGAVTTTWSSTNALVEMSGAGVTKASTLARVCAERGVDASEVVAFGDMPNDVDMLRWVGTSYAMENGHAHAREAAEHVAPRNDEDGVAQVLERLLPECVDRARRCARRGPRAPGRAPAGRTRPPARGGRRRGATAATSPRSR